MMVRLFSRDAVAKSPCTCGSLPGIYILTPPFGFALFYVKGILPPEVKIQEVYKGVIPFIIIICIVTALCAVFPPLVTWLPSLLAS